MADKAEDKKRSPSVKSILGGDILANDFLGVNQTSHLNDDLHLILHS
jgi:hypothetical protein